MLHYVMYNMEDIVRDGASVTVVSNNVCDNLIIIPLRYIDFVFSLGEYVDFIRLIEFEIESPQKQHGLLHTLTCPITRNGQQRPIKAETLQQKRLLQFSDCEISIYM